MCYMKQTRIQPSVGKCFWMHEWKTVIININTFVWRDNTDTAGLKNIEECVGTNKILLLICGFFFYYWFYLSYLSPTFLVSFPLVNVNLRTELFEMGLIPYTDSLHSVRASIKSDIETPLCLCPGSVSESETVVLDGPRALTHKNIGLQSFPWSWDRHVMRCLCEGGKRSHQVFYKTFRGILYFVGAQLGLRLSPSQL